MLACVLFSSVIVEHLRWNFYDQVFDVELSNVEPSIPSFCKS